MTVIPEYMKLRQYLINLTLKDDSSKPIASERELAERFGVTRRTIRRALDDMVRDNYLIRRPRSGYYVSERAWFPHLRQRKTIGVFIVDGMNAFYGRAATNRSPRCLKKRSVSRSIFRCSRAPIRLWWSAICGI